MADVGPVQAPEGSRGSEGRSGLTRAEFWKSQSGLDIRAEQWGRFSAYELYRSLVDATAKAYGGKQVQYFTMEDPNVDRDCWPFNRRIYNIGQFKPVLPRHHGCRCWYEVVWDRPPAGLV